MTPLERARLSLEGLSTGDAFGERFFGTDPRVRNARARAHVLPDDPPSGPQWRFTDDTVMGIAIVDELTSNGRIVEASLAARFGSAYRLDPARGYGGTAHTILGELAAGVAWQEAAARPFGGTGSKGNGGAMRSAPIGVFFDNVVVVAEEAVKSALPTHRHADGIAGAVVVAVAAFACAAGEGDDEVWRQVLTHTVAGAVQDNVKAASDLLLTVEPEDAADALGSGGEVLAEDTVGYCLWSALRARSLSLSFEAALFETARGAGDIDTNCAIVGGILAVPFGLSAIGGRVHDHREPLPASLALITPMREGAR